MLAVGARILYKLFKGKSAGKLRPGVIVDVTEDFTVTLRVLDAGWADSGWEGEHNSHLFHGVIRYAVHSSVPDPKLMNPGEFLVVEDTIS